MDLFAGLLTVLGLAFFELILSVDNAIINADILSKSSERVKRWFLVWGLLIAVFVVRGILPWLIVLVATPSLGPVGALTAMFNSDPAVAQAVEASSPLLLIGGGVFLVFLFFHWLFMEPKNYGLKGEKFFHSQGVWFFAVVSLFLALVTWFAINKNSFMGFAAVVGSTAFFIVHGFKQNAEAKEKELLEGKTKGLSDVSKLLYLEVIDSTFSIDSVVGAFAFTLAVPLILIGNGIGALALRELTIRNIQNVKKYVFLKNGAMYSILVLGLLMLSESFGYKIPSWASPIATFAIVGYFFWKSKQYLKANGGKTVARN